jgi:hypothetical protein
MNEFDIISKNTYYITEELEELKSLIPPHINDYDPIVKELSNKIKEMKNNLDSFSIEFKKKAKQIK